MIQIHISQINLRIPHTATATRRRRVLLTGRRTATAHFRGAVFACGFIDVEIGVVGYD